MWKFYYRVKDVLDAMAVGVLFKKTRTLLGRIKNMVWSRYELSFKQETLFKVAIKTNFDAFPKTCWIVGTVRRGSLDFELEPIQYDKSTIVEYMEVSHMSLPCRTVTGPIHMLPGDTLSVHYGKRLTYAI